MLQADSAKNDYGDLPVLVIRQDGDELELYINWYTYLGNDTDDYKYEAKYITTRVDQDEPNTLLGTIPPTAKPLFVLTSTRVSSYSDLGVHHNSSRAVHPMATAPSPQF